MFVPPLYVFVPVSVSVPPDTANAIVLPLLPSWIVPPKFDVPPLTVNIEGMLGVALLLVMIWLAGVAPAPTARPVTV